MGCAGYWLMSYNPAYNLGWSLGGVYDSDGRHIDDRVFSRGERLSEAGGTGGRVLPLYPFGEQRATARLPLRVPVDRTGRPTDFGLAGVGAPVVSDRLGKVFLDHASGDVELLPTTIGDQAEASHAVLNVVRAVDCIDWTRSTVDWGPGGVPGRRPYYVSRLVVRENVVFGLSCFRTAGWQSNFIVSAALVQGIRELGAPEIQLEPV
jgi:hypothetical protein